MLFRYGVIPLRTFTMCRRTSTPTCVRTSFFTSFPPRRRPIISKVPPRASPYSPSLHIFRSSNRVPREHFNFSGGRFNIRRDADFSSIVASRQRNRSSVRALADFSLENPNFHRRILFAGRGGNSIRDSGHYFRRCVFLSAAARAESPAKPDVARDFRRCGPPAESSAEKSRCLAVFSPLSAECQDVR
jgi:hypothetical protein